MRFHSSLDKLAHVEGVLLKRHVKTPFRRHLVKPEGRDWAINTLVINGPKDGPNIVDPTRKTIVLTHGYGSGLGFFYANYDQLASLVDPVSKKPVQIVSIDWLGMGGSSRPAFTKRSSCATPEENEELIKDAENYFVESFEDWRKSVGLETFALGGHSLGGYLCSVYALKHSHRLSSLTLISPFGLLPHPQDSVPVTSEISKQLPFAQRLFLSAWRNNVTPQWVLRGMGWYGPRMASRIVSRRFPTMDENDQRLISDYVYHLSTIRPAAGEYALNALMEIRMTPTEDREANGKATHGICMLVIQSDFG
ncbi:alpha/beta-hydrolase [Rhizoclosmatium globosum]|uniref:Alpha/beta-hydrolase n=1 Tax=Rhizoclosmatium globosum TaxID=329046 RepID=A0A1Y2CUR5_9FUNG|nr:alpha/beta-hydrolase [Rhizoclosmatium globosum]|eukprot:ORY50055.1 alpha/beta-hydrolase [Rhizoclosmatium globosum]